MLAQYQRTDAIGVAKCNDPKTDDQRDDRIASLTTFVQCVDGVEYVLWSQVAIDPNLKLVRQYIQQHLGI